LFTKAKRYLCSVESPRWTIPLPGANIPNEVACVSGFREQSKPMSKSFLSELCMIPLLVRAGLMPCNLEEMERLGALLSDNLLQHATRAT